MSLGSGEALRQLCDRGRGTSHSCLLYKVVGWFWWRLKKVTGLYNACINNAGFSLLHLWPLWA